MILELSSQQILKIRELLRNEKISVMSNQNLTPEEKDKLHTIYATIEGEIIFQFDNQMR